MKYKNIFYFSVINPIGGIETFFYNLAKKYADWDITIFYRVGDPDQVRRLRQFVRCRQYTDGMKIQCERAFFNFNVDIIDNVEAEEYIQIGHGDYKQMGLIPPTHPKITRYLGVSQVVVDGYKSFGIKSELCYNPLDEYHPRKVLNLISATRLTPDKGRNRMELMMGRLERAGIPYIWTIYTDSHKAIKNPNVVYKRPRLDIIDYVANSDYLVQLSDAEGYCFSVAEALSVGTPVIVTNCPVFKEIGVEHGVTGYIFDFDMRDFDPHLIYEHIPVIERYSPKPDRWDEILVPGPSTYKDDLDRIVTVEATQRYFDLELNRQVEWKERLDVTAPRAEILVDAKCAKYV